MILSCTGMHRIQLSKNSATLTHQTQRTGTFTLPVSTSPGPGCWVAGSDRAGHILAWRFRHPASYCSTQRKAVSTNCLQFVDPLFRTPFSRTFNRGPNRPVKHSRSESLPERFPDVNPFFKKNCGRKLVVPRVGGAPFISAYAQCPIFRERLPNSFPAAP